MRRYILTFMAGLFISANCMASDKEIKVSETKESTLYMISDTHEFYKKNNTLTFGMIFKLKNKSNNNKNELFKVFVMKEECKKGYGKLDYYDLRGTYILSEDWINRGSSLNDNTADILCYVSNWK